MLINISDVKTNSDTENEKLKEKLVNYVSSNNTFTFEKQLELLTIATILDFKRNSGTASKKELDMLDELTSILQWKVQIDLITNKFNADLSKFTDNKAIKKYINALDLPEPPASLKNYL